MRILEFFPKNLREIIKETKSALKKGEVVILPTDTVYGLVCDATNAKAVKKIFEIKKRPKEKPIGIFVRDLKMAKKFAKINKKKEKLLEKYWPGKATFILSSRNLLPELVGTTATIGIRIPDYKLIQDLFKEINFPLAQTSANISGKPATTKIKEVLKQFENQELRPDLVIDAGNLKEAKPSTVLDLSSKEPKILRQGEISKKALLEFI